MSEVAILQGDALERLRELPDNSVHCCITSPPYYGLRDYGTATWEGGNADCKHAPEFKKRASRPTKSFHGGGNEQADIAEIGRSNRTHCKHCGAFRVDSQVGLEETPDAYIERLVTIFREVRRILHPSGTLWIVMGDSYCSTAPGTRNAPMVKGSADHTTEWANIRPPTPLGMKPKDLIGIPWMLAFALRADGWYLR